MSRPLPPFWQQLDTYIEKKGAKVFLGELAAALNRYADGFHDAEDIRDVQDVAQSMAVVARELPDGL